MIPVKIIKRSKGAVASPSSTTGSSGASYAQESAHSIYSDQAAKAKMAEQSLHANSAAEIDSDSSLWQVLQKRMEALDDLYLSKQQEDTARGHITFEQGLDSKGDVNVDGSERVGGDMNVDGALEVKGDTTLSDVVVDRVHDAASTPAERVLVGAQGFDLYMGEDGKSHLYIDYLTARTRFFAASAEIRKVSYSGGTTLFSNAGSTIVKVAHVMDAGGKNIVAYKCYALADDGTTRTMNWWHVGMMALCQTFNVKAGTTDNLANRYYWRMVVGVGQETLDDGKLYDYVLLSNMKTFLGGDSIIPVYGTRTLADENGKALVWGNVMVQVAMDGGTRSMASVFDEQEGKTADDGGTSVASRVFYGYEPREDGTEPDAPQPYDVIVQAGDQIQWKKYGNLIKLTTATEDGNDGNAPSIAMYYYMGAPYGTGKKDSDGNEIINPYQWKTLTSLSSPLLELHNTETFKWFTGTPDNIIDPITVSYGIEASSEFIIKHPSTQTATPDDVTFRLYKRTGNKKDYQTSGFAFYCDYQTTDGNGKRGVVINKLSDIGDSFYNLQSVTVYAKAGKNDQEALATFMLPVLSDGSKGDKGADGKKGDDGKDGSTPTITSTTYLYAVSGTVAKPADTAFSSLMPDPSKYAGHFLWTKIINTWSTGEKTEVVTCTYIGKDGANGTSVTIKGTFDKVSDLPTSGTNGDGYIIDGYLWVYTATKTEDANNHNGFTKVGKIQGEDGKNATQYYIHTAWMKGADGTGFTTSNPNGAAYPYAGTLVDTNEKDSEAWQDYDWVYLKGDTGAQGEQGPQGEQGEKGDKGDRGPQGEQGEQGDKGEKGDTGDRGPQGEQGEKGDTGASGTDALEFVMSGVPMVFDTDDNGVVPSSVSKTGKITIYQGGKNISTSVTGVVTSDTLNCRATIAKDMTAKCFTVTIQGSSIAKDTSLGVSKTSGYAVVQFTYAGTAYIKQVPFEVNVAKFTGTVNATAKKLATNYTELATKTAAIGNDVDTLTDTVNDIPLKTKDQLTEYSSSIEQTARQISLNVGSKVIDRSRNILPGSDFHRQGYGYKPNGTGTTEASLRIRTYDGLSGCNSMYIQQDDTDTTVRYKGVQWYKIPVTGGKAYTISVWAKRMSYTFGNGCTVIIHEYNDNSNMVASQVSYKLLDTTSDPKGTWRMKTFSFTAKADTILADIIFCLGSNGAFSIAQPMMEEGSEYNGWSLSENDYSFIGGNIIDGTKTLTANTALPPSDGTVGYISALSGTTDTSDGVTIVSRSAASDTTQMALVMKAYLKAGTDYTLSFDVRRTDGLDNGCAIISFVRSVLYSELYTGRVSIYSKEQGNAKETGYFEIKPTGQWTRVWVHFRLYKDWDTATGVDFNIGVHGASGKSATMQFRRPKLEAMPYPSEYTERNATYIEEANIAEKLQEAGIDIMSGFIRLRANKTAITGDLTVQGAITDSTSYVGTDGTFWKPGETGELEKGGGNLYVDEGGGLFVPINMTGLKSVQIQTSDPSVVSDTLPTPSTALVTLPMYDTVNLGCGVTLPAYRRSGTHVLLRNAFSLAYSQWSNSNQWGDDTVRRNVANACVYICTDPRLLSLSNYTDDGEVVAVDGRDRDGKFATADWFKGCMYLNGRRGRWLCLMPGQQVELVSAIAMWRQGTNTPVPYLTWYVVGGDDLVWMEKDMHVQTDDHEATGSFSAAVSGGESMGVGSADKYSDAFFGPRQLSDKYLSGVDGQTVDVELSASHKPYVNIITNR